MNWTDRDAVNLIGRNLASLREDGEGALIVSFGAISPSTDCPGGNMLVTIRKDGEEATSEAVSLQDAIYLARAKVNTLIKRRNDEREEAKRKETA